MDPDQILDVVEPFLAECGAAPTPAHDDRVLVTLVATDLAERHHEIVRGELARYRGREIESTADRILASSDGPARAVRCATAITHAARPLGVAVRAGVHTAEVEVVHGRMRGIALDMTARIAAEAAPGEVLVSQTVKALVAGSGLEFAERGSRVAAGVPGEWRLLAVE